MFKVPNKFRLKNHPLLGSDDSFGNNGFFIIPHGQGLELRVQASDGSGWEHCSVSIAPTQGQARRCPTWDEMCKIKDIFWDDEDSVIQYHPPKSKYVNTHKFVLHLWRSTTTEIPIPDESLIGIK